MPRIIYFPPTAYDKTEGVQASWHPSTQHLEIKDWHDTDATIKGESLSLSNFFYRLGITQDDCKRAFKGHAAS